jgi:hypothetical protein
LSVMKVDTVTHTPISRQRLVKKVSTNTRPTIQERCFLWSILCAFSMAAPRDYISILVVNQKSVVEFFFFFIILFLLIYNLLNHTVSNK